MAATVLIVDDHPTFRRFARRLLEQAGFSVVGEAADAAGAIASARELRPSAVLLDVLLPDRSGLEVAAELAKEDAPPSVILTSSRSEQDLGVRLRDAPARGFIPKASLTAAAFAELIG
jgi:two-component system, NarL family, nitrate/nitrite response regulator NarL